MITLLFAVVANVSAAFAEKRVALVIGNANYEHAVSLANPGNDAIDVATALERLGFLVRRENNLGRHAMRDVLAEFSDTATGADKAVIFFAGHGIGIDKQNYLIPVDAQLKSDRKVKFETVSLDTVVAALDGVQGVRMVLLDACRNNPFTSSMKVTSASRSISRGFARVEPSRGTLISFSAKDGTTADDGTGRNSPYTSALLQHLEQPGLELQFMFRKVRDKVLDATGGRQEPFTYGSLPGREIYLVKPDAAKQTTQPDVGADRETVFWTSIKDSKDPAVFEAYLKQFPDGTFASLARLRLETAKARLAGVIPPNAGAREIPPLHECDRLAAKPLDTSKLGDGVAMDRIPAKRAIAACRQAVAAYPDTTRFEFQLGRALHAGKNANEALIWYRKAVDKRYPAAMHNLGLMYQHGFGVVQSDEDAVHWYRRSADMGHAAAMTSIGTMYQVGRGVTRSDEEAARWLRKAADLGDPLAMSKLGYIYIYGLGVEQSDQEGVHWYRKAADRGNANGMFAVGLAYAKGQGVRQDDREAVRWYRRAADKGQAGAMTNLASRYNSGQGIERNPAIAAELMLKALRKNEKSAVREMTTNANAWGEPFRRALQRLMRQQGAYTGPIDGDFGPATLRAIRSLAEQ